MKELILASNSPRREELLRQIGLKFRVIPSFVSEELPPGLTPMESVQILALRKVKEVAKDIVKGIVIGADTVVVINNLILGKPSGPDEAFTMLTMLNGTEHSVFTGLAVFDVSQNQPIVDFVETRVRFRKLSAEEIRNYIASGEPFDKAGAYGIQGLGAILVEAINGCYFNVVGLPLSKLAIIFEKMGYSYFK